MAKALPTEFESIRLDNFTVGRAITGRDYRNLVERSHYLWALNRGRCPGGFVGNNVDASIGGANQYREHNFLIRPKRLLASGVYRLGVDFLIRNVDLIRFRFYRLVESGPPVEVATTTAAQVDLDLYEWRRLIVNIDEADLLQGGEIRPVLVKITDVQGANPGFGLGGDVARCVAFEAGIDELSASDIP